MPRLRPRAYSVSTAAPRSTSNTPAAIAARGRPQARATSAAPVTAKASAVSKAIALWLPKVTTVVARAYHAAITATPTAAHSRPPAVVIAPSTLPPRDRVPAGPSAAARGGDASTGAGPGRTSSAPWISIALHPRQAGDGKRLYAWRSRRRAQGASPAGRPPRATYELAKRSRHAGSPEHSFTYSYYYDTRCDENQAAAGQPAGWSLGLVETLGLVDGWPAALMTVPVCAQGWVKPIGS
jgi:hypothetical protein